MKRVPEDELDRAAEVWKEMVRRGGSHFRIETVGQHGHIVDMTGSAGFKGWKDGKPYKEE